MECTIGAERDTSRRNRKAMKEHTGMRKAYIGVCSVTLFDVRHSVLIM